MGIEGFFNSLKSDYSIVKDIYPKDKTKYKINSLFFDFNSIIHVISVRVLSFINKLMINCITTANKKYVVNYKEVIHMIDPTFLLLKDFNMSIGTSKYDENDIIKYFNEYFTDSLITSLIILNIKLNIKQLLKNHFDNNELKLVHIAIDGVPNKAKIVEQKKRRYMGIFVGDMIKKIFNKHKNNLKNAEGLYNKYNVLKNKISWNKSLNISPATSFMIKLDEELNVFKKELEKTYKDLKVIISGFKIRGEGETKIVDFINYELSPKNSKNICIYSPDADVILLALLLNNKNIKQSYVWRNDQQKSAKEVTNIIDNVDSIIDISRLEKIILLQYSDNTTNDRLKDKNIINDIIFIFTFFGDDFLHKLESINVKMDIQFLTNIYGEYLKQNKNKYIYLLENHKDQININYDNFLFFLKQIIPYEDYFLKRNYLLKTYHNAKKLFKDEQPKKNDHSIFKHIIKTKRLYKWTNTIFDSYHQSKVNSDDPYEVELYQFNNMLDEFNLKLNHHDDIKLGKYYEIITNKDKSKFTKINDKEFYNSKKRFYKKYFSNKQDALNNYNEGLIWILDHYYNNTSYDKWYYKYDKSPLLTDIYYNLKNNIKNDRGFYEIRSKLSKYYKTHIPHGLSTPLEQLLYIIPFRKGNHNNTNDKLIDNIFRLYSQNQRNKIKNIVSDIFHSHIKCLYPDLNSITSYIYTHDKNDLIDCNGAYFMSKCTLKVVHESNKIKNIDLSNLVRETLPVEKQKVLLKGGMIKKYKKYKSLYYSTGKMKHKYKFNKYKKLLRYD